MPIQYIIDYLKQNKDKFPLDALKKKLIEAGYPEKEIEDAIDLIQKPEKIPTKFWDFRHKKIYLSKKEKFLDFIFGIFVGVIIALLIGLITTLFWRLLPLFPYSTLYFFRYFAFILKIIFYLGLIIYFFKIKRGYISFGMILFPFLLILLGLTFLLTAFIFLKSLL